MKRVIKIGADQYEVTLIHRNGTSLLQVAGMQPVPVSIEPHNSNDMRVRTGTRKAEITLAVKGENVFIKAFGRTFAMQVLDPVDQAHEAAETGDLSAKAPMPGLVVEIHVEVGSHVGEGQDLITIESMKLLTVLKASGDGIVEKIHFDEGEAFNKGVTLVSLAGPGGEDHA